tara:strand:- start:10146 stop:10889 length:744 start_codon:yes stop_codon:yes gene_type:complete
MNRSLTVLLLSLMTLPCLAQVFDFDVLLNDKPIGRHQINITVEPEGRTVVQGDADYTVKLLGITLFAYEHQHREVWDGNCLNAFASTTVTNGEIEQLTVTRNPEGYALITLKADKQFARDQLPCAWSYAYWRKGFTTQQQLMNGQTGALSSVSIERLTLDMPIQDGAYQDGASQNRASQNSASQRSALAMLPASAALSSTAGAGDRYQLVTKDQTIIVHYSPAGRWNGLNVELAPNRVLTYRPRSTR